MLKNQAVELEHAHHKILEAKVAALSEGGEAALQEAHQALQAANEKLFETTKKLNSADEERKTVKKLLRTTKFPAEFDTKVNMKKVKLDVMMPWITQQVTQYLGFEDEVVIGYVEARGLFPRGRRGLSWREDVASPLPSAGPRLSAGGACLVMKSTCVMKRGK